MEVVSQAERVQQQEQVHLADAELDVPAGWRLLPPQQPILPEEVDALGGREHAALLIQPPRFVDTLTSGEHVTMRSPTPLTSARRVRIRPNVSCVDTRPVVGIPVPSGTSNRGRGGTGTLFSSPPVVRACSTFG